MEVILAVAVIIFFVIKIVNSSDNKKENGNTPVAPMPADFGQFEKTFTQEKQKTNMEQQSSAFDSTEGTESSEGKCIEPNPSHCVVEHPEDSVYASEIGTEENAFTHEDIVKGVIMSEILSKPKSLQ